LKSFWARKPFTEEIPDDARFLQDDMLSDMVDVADHRGVVTE
jgi:hypothetical protein